MKPSDELRWADIDRLWTAALIVVALWVAAGVGGFDWPDKTITRLPTTAPAVLVDARTLLTVPPSYGLTDAEMRSLYADALEQHRTTTATTLPPSPPPEAAAPAETAPVAVQERAGEQPPLILPAAPARSWQPTDECHHITRPVPQRTMRWCPTVAHYLHQYGDWDPGDLTRLLRIIDCESAGNPSAVNRTSRASGLFQHLPRYWGERGAKAARVFGFDNPTILAPFDNIAVGVWLYETGGRGHWPTCGKR